MPWSDWLHRFKFGHHAQLIEIGAVQQLLSTVGIPADDVVGWCLVVGDVDGLTGGQVFAGGFPTASPAQPPGCHVHHFPGMPKAAGCWNGLGCLKKTLLMLWASCEENRYFSR
ncbi:hypothetical protein [Azospirillum formosense]|uniref:hypothetical protein n=1 Tax=Azospirillum formosense TaxID=861533 RepID=UPI00157B4B69|nr:hypothetical protein [Azospirillum formosense]